MHRRTSSPLLQSRQTQNSGKFIWPRSAWTVSFPLGMVVLSRLRTAASITHSHSLRVLSLLGSTFVHWSNGTLSRALLSDFGSRGQVECFFSGPPGSSQPWWSSSSSLPRFTPLGLVLSPPTSQSGPVSSRSLLQSSVSLGTGSSARQHGHTSRSSSRVVTPHMATAGLMVVRV